MPRGKPDLDPEDRRREEGDHAASVDHRPHRMPAQRAGPLLPHLWGVVPGEAAREPVGPVDPAAEDGEEGGEERDREQHRHADHDQSAQADAPGLDQRRQEQRAEPDHHRESRGDDRLARRHHRAHRGQQGPQAASQLLAEAGHHQQRIVDAHAEADHGRHVEHEDRHRREMGDDADDRERDRDRQDADDERQRRRPPGRRRRAPG